MKLRKLPHNQHGFTLVELLISMALMAGFLLILTNILLSALETKAEAESTTAAELDGRYILARVSADVMRASSISVPTTLGTSGTTLSLVIQGITYTYTLSGTNLELADGTGSYRLNSSETTISSITFTRIGNTMSSAREAVKLDLTLESATQKKQGNVSRSFSLVVGKKS